MKPETEADNLQKKMTSGKVFDSPIIVKGEIDKEPKCYLAEKPYELTRFEYSILKKPLTLGTWFNLSAGATIGLIIAIISKVISLLIDKNSITIEYWEWIGVLIGIVLSLFFKKIYKSEEDKEKEELLKVVNSHFESSKPRRIHLTLGDKNEN